MEFCQSEKVGTLIVGMILTVLGESKAEAEKLLSWPIG